LNSGFWSIVCVIKLLNANHRLAVDTSPSMAVPIGWLDDPKPADIWARFFENRSLSSLSNFSFLFIAPGLCFRLLCFITATGFTSTPGPPSPASGKASTRECRFATSFFDGRRRLGFFLRDFSIFVTNVECLIKRLSFLLVLKSSLKIPGCVLAAFRDVENLLLALDLVRIGA